MFLLPVRYSISFFFFFNDTATTEIYTLSLHDALPIYFDQVSKLGREVGREDGASVPTLMDLPDRKSTRLNSSHLVISYAVFCLKKKKKITANLTCSTIFSWRIISRFTAAHANDYRLGS